MNFRTPLSVLAFVAFAAPLAAHADAPSGEFYDLHPVRVETPAPAADRADKEDRSSYAEFSIWDAMNKNDAAGRVISREEVVRELASSPLPDVTA